MDDDREHNHEENASEKRIKRAVVKCFDMSEEMLQKAVDYAAEALAKFTVRKDMALYIKKKFDDEYGQLWHCVVGKDFGR